MTNFTKHHPVPNAGYWYDPLEVDEYIQEQESYIKSLRAENIRLINGDQAREDAETIQELEAQIKELSSASSHGPSDVPTCPNCSTSSKPIYMSSLGEQFRAAFDATHKCPKCEYMAKITT